MKQATQNDKQLIINILSESFADNKSVNYLLPQESNRQNRLKNFMGYAFDVCHQSGNVFLTDDNTACALALLPDKKKLTLKSIGWDLKFIFRSIGLKNIKKALNREAQIKVRHPKGKLCYLWFIGVRDDAQGRGIGSKLLTQIILEAEKQNRTVCLETSTVKNLPWYKKFGFEVYDELDLGYGLFFLKRG